MTLSPTSPPTETASATPSPTVTASQTPVPTYVTLRGKVIVDQAVCHYGPGAPYLYKYAVIRDSNLEIIARVARGTYIQVQAIGGDNPCWVNPQWMEIQGDLNSVRPMNAEDVQLPWTPYYSQPPTGVSAQRQGNEVTVSWNPVTLKAGDDSEQVPYVIEAWVCQDGNFVFTPLGAWQTQATIVDEPGCQEPSHARLLASEKHGYLPGAEIPWPLAE
ncbi:MAG: hypothetical protein GYA17_08885 [Chloroflexi bacterium]|nr:hypothetical protein [Anaerolineaceae bacterium]NMB88462.1 hypothetical protein [Chloroflexota bacterium]